MRTSWPFWVSAEVYGAMMGRWLTVLITLFGAVAICHGKGDGANSNPVLVWCGIADFVLSGHVFNTTVTKTHKLCWEACKAQAFCVSSNFEARSGHCRLNNVTHCDYPRHLIEGRGWVYTYSSQIQNPGCTAQKAPQPLSEPEEGAPGWPLGTYGLPMPTAGCPAKAGFTWQTGYRLHDTENTNTPNNLWSDVLHLQGPYAKSEMQQNFCMKTTHRVSEKDLTWPDGKYCVFQFGDKCPNDMSTGSIFWDDEDTVNHNAVNGTVPAGEYNQDTLINFCCMIAGNVSLPIVLPTGHPFYLFAYGSEQCQEVHGMSASEEWFRWDDEDSNNDNQGLGSHPYDCWNQENHRLYYCFYQSLANRTLTST